MRLSIWKILENSLWSYNGLEVQYHLLGSLYNLWKAKEKSNKNFKIILNFNIVAFAHNLIQVFIHLLKILLFTSCFTTSSHPCFWGYRRKDSSWESHTPHSQNTDVSLSAASKSSELSFSLDLGFQVHEEDDIIKHNYQSVGKSR